MVVCVWGRQLRFLCKEGRTWRSGISLAGFGLTERGGARGPRQPALFAAVEPELAAQSAPPQIWLRLIEQRR